MWLLTIPPYLEYEAALRRNFSLIACFLTLMFHSLVWQVATHASCGGILITHLLQIFCRMSERILKIGQDLTELWP